MGIRQGPANQHGDQKSREGDVAYLNDSTGDFKQPDPSFRTIGSQTKNAIRTTNCTIAFFLRQVFRFLRSLVLNLLTSRYARPIYSHPITLEPRSRYYRAGSSYHGRSPHRQPSLVFHQALCSMASSASFNQSNPSNELIAPPTTHRSFADSQATTDPVQDTLARGRKG